MKYCMKWKMLKVLSRFCRMNFTNAFEIGKEILKFNIFLITEYTYRVCIFVVEKFQEKNIKIVVEISIKNVKGNKIENTFIIAQKLIIKYSTGQNEY